MHWEQVFMKYFRIDGVATACSRRPSGYSLDATWVKPWQHRLVNSFLLHAYTTPHRVNLKRSPLLQMVKAKSQKGGISKLQLHQRRMQLLSCCGSERRVPQAHVFRASSNELLVCSVCICKAASVARASTNPTNRGMVGRQGASSDDQD